MINHKYKCIFIHIPKNGGTSIESILGNWELTPENYTKLIGTKYHSQHHKLNSLRKDLREKYFSFAFVRNPWDRVVSLYSYYKSGGNQRADLSIKNKMPNNFKSFVIDKWNIIPRSHRIEQFNYIKADGKINNIDFIGKFESIDKDWEYVAKKIGVDKNLPHIRASKHKKYLEYYDDETRQIIENRYANDIKFFKYQFGK